MKKSIVTAILFILSVVLLIKLAGAEQRFDHNKHANLFPLCTSCHEGIETGAQAELYPSRESCANCHDGKVERKVDWQGPQRVASNLKFEHPEHFAEAKDSDCAACHAKSPGAKRMNVVRAQAETCIACHQKDKGAAPVQHFAQNNDCTQCHKPLRDARALAGTQIAAFPQPPSHKQADFLQAHARTDLSGVASCATCHTAESCSRCHANARDVKVIAALGNNELVTGLVAGKKAVYPEPPDHKRAGFAESHGALAEANVQRCSNCHTREGCLQCHSGRVAADEIAALPLRDVAPGVDMPARGRVHPANFATAHGNTAGANGESCTSCHAESFCSDCHQGADSRKFHPANFVSRHAQAVYAGETECSSCHSRETFCQSCHNRLGMTANGERTTQFHTGQAIWLLQHGQPARQNLESCTSCHTQSSCARCHSSKGGWGVSPHGSAVPSGKLADKNQITCLRCHYSGTFRR
ncbi:MAG TPA: cytochrome c3 family protein [Longimicrobiales bacterium]